MTTFFSYLSSITPKLSEEATSPGRTVDEGGSTSVVQWVAREGRVGGKGDVVQFGGTITFTGRLTSIKPCYYIVNESSVLF